LICASYFSSIIKLNGIINVQLTAVMVRAKACNACRQLKVHMQTSTDTSSALHVHTHFFANSYVAMLMKPTIRHALGARRWAENVLYLLRSRGGIGKRGCEYHANTAHADILKAKHNYSESWRDFVHNLNILHLPPQHQQAKLICRWPSAPLGNPTSTNILDL
jgi:hypothetical protein